MYTQFDRRMLWVNRILLGFLVFITVIPLIYVLIASFMDPTTLINQGISFNPADWTIQGYQRVFADDSILRGLFQFLVLLVLIQCFNGFDHDVNSLPVIKARPSRKKCHHDVFRDYNVRWWGLDPNLLID